MAGLGDPSDISRKQGELRATTAERLEAIVEAAERAAEGVIDDAEEQARRYLSQALAEADRIAANRNDGISELIDSLLGQTRSLRQEAERLQASLEGAQARIEGSEPQQRLEESEESEEPEGPAGPAAPRLRAVLSEGERASESRAARPDSAGARLLATQMAISGSSREEIARRLRNGFEVEDADAILDAILGPEER
jgi:cell division septum initiation protein DivIVA